MKKISIFLFLLIIQGCKVDDNCQQECFTPPQSFVFKLLDSTSGENIFSNDYYVSEDLKITDVLNANKTFDFTFISENNLNLIEIGAIGWETEAVRLSFEIKGSPIFEFEVDAERKTENCCSYTSYNEIKVENSDFELNSETGIYTIFLN